MKVRIKWVENVTFVAETESSHAIVMDGAPEGGGRNLGPRPMETMLAGTGGCTAYDVVTILRKARQNVSDCVVEIDAERAAQEPKVFTRIHFHFIVTGRDVDAKQVDRRDSLVSGKVLLGLHHAGEDGRHHARLRDPRERRTDAQDLACIIHEDAPPDITDAARSRLVRDSYWVHRVAPGYWALAVALRSSRVPHELSRLVPAECCFRASARFRSSPSKRAASQA